jgi:hypothetical protein
MLFGIGADYPYAQLQNAELMREMEGKVNSLIPCYGKIIVFLLFLVDRKTNGGPLMAAQWLR